MDIYDLLFYDILKFDYSTSVLTGEFGNDILYGLLIPGILIFMVISEFTSVFAGSHSKMKNLITIATLGVIIQSGWYATIAGFSGVYFPLAIIFFVIMFFKRRIIARNQEGAGMGMMGKLLSASGVGGHMKDAIHGLQPGRSDGEINTAAAEILAIGVSFDDTKNKPAQGMFVQSNTAQTLKLLVEEARDELVGFNAKDKEKIIIKALNQRGINDINDLNKDEFLTLLKPLLGLKS